MKRIIITVAITTFIVLIGLGILGYFLWMNNVTMTCATAGKPLINQIKKERPNATMEEIKDELRNYYVDCLKAKGYPNAERQRYRLK